MFPISVGNLYIGKLGIKLMAHGEINGCNFLGANELDPTTIVDKLFKRYSKTLPNEPDYYLSDGYWNHVKGIFLINPIETSKYTIWVTGVPLEDDIREYWLEHSLVRKVYKDSHRVYLIQITHNVTKPKRLVI